MPVSAYRTQTNRKRLVGAFCDKFALVRAVFIREDCEFLLTASNNKALIINTALIPVKATKSTQGVIVFTQKGKNTLTEVKAAKEAGIKKHRLLQDKRQFPPSGTFKGQRLGAALAAEYV